MNGTETKTATTKAITPETSEAITNTTSTDEITDTTPDSKTTETPEASTPDTSTPNELPQHYLSCGYYKGEGTGRYLDPDLVDRTAKQIAKGLATGGLKQLGYNPILRELKRADKKTLPLEAKHGALSGGIVAAKRLKQRKRASGLLVEVLECNRAAVQTDADYTAAVKHLTAVGVYLGDYQQQATEGTKK